MNTQHTSIFRPVMTPEQMHLLLDSMTEEEANAALVPGQPHGEEFKRAAVSSFIKTRRLARENGEMGEENRQHIRATRRRLAVLEAVGDPFGNCEKTLEYRMTLASLQRFRERLNKTASSLGQSIRTSSAILPMMLPREKLLDLLNVGSEMKLLMGGREREFSFYELLRYGFADANDRAVRNAAVEPQMFCLMRWEAAQREHVPQVTEASPEEFAKLDAELHVYRKQAIEVIAELDAVVQAERAMNESSVSKAAKNFVPTCRRRLAASERAFALWPLVEKALSEGGKGFSLQQKLAILRADPAKVEQWGDKLPEDATLMELVGGAQIEFNMPDEPCGVLLAIGVNATMPEMRDQAELARAVVSGDGDLILAASAKVYGEEYASQYVAVRKGSPTLH